VRFQQRTNFAREASSFLPRVSERAGGIAGAPLLFGVCEELLSVISRARRNEEGHDLHLARKFTGSKRRRILHACKAGRDPSLTMQTDPYLPSNLRTRTDSGTSPWISTKDSESFQFCGINARHCLLSSRVDG
jgi:hypothetical protein